MNEKKTPTISASPKARKFAREIGANLHLVKGSQREGRINEEDIKAFVKNSLTKKPGEIIIEFLPVIKKRLNKKDFIEKLEKTIEDKTSSLIY